MDEFKHFFIKLLWRIQSKKFLVWSMATVGLFTHFLSGDDWMAISIIYLGAQGMIDWKHNDNIIKSTQESIPDNTSGAPARS